MVRHHWKRLAVVLTVGLGVAAGIAPAAHAGGDEDELAVADGLLDVRYFDLAEFIYKRAIAKGGSAKTQGEIGLVKVLKYKARGERDPELQKKLFDDAISKLREILKGGSGDVDSKFQLGDLLAEKGQSLIDQMEVAEDETLKEQLRRDAQDAYTQVSELFTDVVKEYKPKYLAAKDPESGDVDPKKFPRAKVGDLIKSWMLQGESLFHRGRIETDKRKRDQDLKKAIELLADFVWEFEDRVVGFWGYIFQGRAYTALGKFAEAADVFRSVLDLPVDDATEDVRMIAYWHYGEALNAATQFTECAELIQQAEKEYPGALIKKSQGQAAILEWGKALAGTQDFKGGIAKALDVVNAPVPFLRATALGLLAEWAAMDPTVGAKIAFLQGSGLRNQAYLLRRDDIVFLAIAAFHEAAQRISSPEEKAEYGVKIWQEIGESYFGLEMFHEAGLAFEKGARVEAGTEAQRGECAYWWYRSTQERYKITKPNPFDKALYGDARSYFSSTFPSHPRMGNIPFYEARDYEDDGKFLEAATKYEQLDKDSEKYEIALARAGGCYYKEFDNRRDAAEKKGREPTASDKQLLDQATTKLKDFLKRTEAEDASLDEAKQETRLNARGLSVFYLARVCEAKGDLEGLLTTLAGFKDTFGDKQKGLVSSVLMLELQALGKLKRVDEAAGKLDELREFNSRYYLLGTAQQLVASLFDGMADDLEKQDELAAAAEYRRRAAAFFHGWIMGDEDARKNKDNVVGVAYRCAKVAKAEDEANRVAEALDFYDKGASLFQTLRENQKKLKLSDKESGQVDIMLQECRVRSAELLEANGRLEEAVGAWRAVLPLLKELYDAQIAKSKRASKTITERLANAYSKADKLDEALDLFGTLVKGNKAYAPEWWDAKYWIIEIQFRKHLALKEKGQSKPATDMLVNVKELLENLRLVTPTLGGKEMAALFAELAGRAGLKDGWEGYKK